MPLSGRLCFLRMAAFLELGPYTHLGPWCPLCSSSSPARGPALKALACSSSEEVPPMEPLGWQRKGGAICHRVAPSLACVPTGINASPFLSSGSCSLQTPAEPTAWPWPSRTLCGEPGATGELWSHCKCAPGLRRHHSTSGQHSCRQASACHLGIRAASVCPPRPLPCAPCCDELRESA